jgi:hypothetical protein
LKKSLSQEPLHIDNFILASPCVPPGLFQRATSVPVLWLAYDSWGSHYHNFDKTAIPLKKSLNQELLYIYNFLLASVRVAPDIFQRAPSVPVLWFAYDSWGSHYHNFDKTAIPLKQSLSQEPLHIDNFILASPCVPPDLFQRATSVPVLWLAYDSWGSHYHNFDKTAIPLKKSLNQELLYIYTFLLASIRVAPDIFQRAPSVPVLWFAYDRWGSHSMPQSFHTTAIPFKKSLTQERLHIYNFILASVLVPPGRFQRAPSIAVWFVDMAHSMPHTTTKTFTERLYH